MVSKVDKDSVSNVLRLSRDDRAVRCVVMRGGTSRGLFFHEQDLPADPARREQVIMGALGAPDPRQVDGLGGADMLLSKVAIIARSESADADVECEFANMAPGKERPTYGTNCGNLVSAVALFAVEEGLVPAGKGDSVVRIRNRNSGSLIVAHIRSSESDSGNGSGAAGMSDTGVCVDLDFLDPVGTVQNDLLPTGNVRDTVLLDGGRSVDVTIVDAGALYVFVNAKDLGLSATETHDQVLACPDTLESLERLRSKVAQKIGLVDAAADATRLSPDVPKLAFVGPPVSFDCDASSNKVAADAIDLVSRIISSQKYHKAYAVTGAIATAAAATIQGSTVHEAAVGNTASGSQKLRIGHPSGVMTCEAESRLSNGKNEVVRVTVRRTARRIMQGTVFVPEH